MCAVAFASACVFFSFRIHEGQEERGNDSAVSSIRARSRLATIAAMADLPSGRFTTGTVARTMPTARGPSTMLLAVTMRRRVRKSRRRLSGRDCPPERRLRDFRTLRRIVTASSIVLGPLAVGIVRATVPVVNLPDGKSAIAAMVANLDLARIELTAESLPRSSCPSCILKEKKTHADANATAHIQQVTRSGCPPGHRWAVQH